jgi:hypothetical protein
LTAVLEYVVLNVMKRYFVSLLFSALAIFAVVSPVLGIAYPDGQQHYYSVLMRGNGEAIVSFKAHFSNISEQPVSKVTLQVPQGTVSDVSAYQLNAMLPQPPCNPVFEPSAPQTMSAPATIQPSDVTYGAVQSFEKSAIGGTTVSPAQPLIMPCKMYPDYRMPSYEYGYGNQYTRADVTINGQTLTISLPTEVTRGQDGNYFLTYRTNSIAHKTILGAYAYTFDTLKFDAPVSDVQIGIATDENFFFKDARGNINYTGTVSISKALPAVATGGVSNTALDTYYNQIGQGTVYKTASHLSPNESYTVTGTYADSKWKLYGKEIGITLIVVILLLGAIVFGSRAITRRMKMKSAEGKQQPFFNRILQKHMLLSVASIGFVAAVGIVIFTVILYILGSVLGDVIGYSTFQPILFVLIVLTSTGVYALLLLGPAIVASIKRNIVWGIAIFGVTVAWIALFTFILFLALLFTKNQGVIPQYRLYNDTRAVPLQLERPQ